MPKDINVIVTIDKKPQSKEEKILQLARIVVLLYKWKREEKLKNENLKK